MCGCVCAHVCRCLGVCLPRRCVCEHTFLRASARWPFFQKDTYVVGGTAQMCVSKCVMSPVLMGLRGRQGWGRGAA